ncbi:hypothetical protein PENFLA_c006G02122 [Penicillium flavigenum]|uniref:Uncharacterized protein n=1 Tax=Penicillium flavigenum TaxID=254877 RepID=A0A1V6TLE2_9EURO|nr:hypothetical protein PENFLA_c006G02122 [Penicillium flavigenum]
MLTPGSSEVPSAKLCHTDRFGWSFKKEGQPSDLKQTDSGESVYTLSWKRDASDSTKLPGPGALEISNQYDAEVKFKGRSILITPAVTVYLKVLYKLQEGAANVVEEKVTDEYVLGISPEGSLNTTHLKPIIEDRCDQGRLLATFVCYRDASVLIENLQHEAKIATSLLFETTPLSTVSSFVFPGGRTFAHSNVGFSNYQDLVSAIRYVG